MVRAQIKCKKVLYQFASPHHATAAVVVISMCLRPVTCRGGNVSADRSWVGDRIVHVVMPAGTERGHHSCHNRAGSRGSGILLLHTGTREVRVPADVWLLVYQPSRSLARMSHTERALLYIDSRDTQNVGV